ncbi:hypothetical protein TRVA0_007S01244 [Trichomonascus vanleenenianus]|uniref:uncharacterized protein n=1 Tax=Trichomonascus vanleenenianus TaxID=2268995 RepID=UPI003ECBAA41
MAESSDCDRIRSSKSHKGASLDHHEYEDRVGKASSFILDAARCGDVTHNPLKDISRDQCIRSATEFATKHGLDEDVEYFVKGALLAQSGETDLLTEDELDSVIMEVQHKWRQPVMLYYLTIMCAMCAVVQGMDETVVNGAQTYYTSLLGMDTLPNSQWIEGLVVGAPYLCCALIGCALTEPLNNLIGRRGVIFVSCFIAAAASIWEGFTFTWQQLFGARFLLGLGIGPKSTTVPVFAAECTPAPIRGALVMMWQMWTAFGIMLGYIVCVALKPNGRGITPDTSWRLMLGSTVVAPVIVCIQVFFVPESPRWYVKKGQVKNAYNSLVRLRTHRVLAARDLYYMAIMIAINDEINKGRNVLADIFLIGRNRRALYASQIVMFMQQFCGVNVIAYYSSNIFKQANFGEVPALLASMGFGILNFLFAIPAVFTIDTFGRRSLALFTLPFLALFLLFTGFSFFIRTRTARVGCITLGIYLYTIFYSPGMGPVPFTYSAECFPLHVRDVGMSLATITLWGFNFILSLTWPALVKAFTSQGAFGYYAAWNVVGYFLVFFFVPETKARTLEELDITFSLSTRKFVRHHLKYLPYNFRRYVLLQKNLPPKEDVYDTTYDYDDNNIY